VHSQWLLLLLLLMQRRQILQALLLLLELLRQDGVICRICHKDVVTPCSMLVIPDAMKLQASTEHQQYKHSHTSKPLLGPTSKLCSKRLLKC
jgi:hypothetical protein